MRKLFVTTAFLAASTLAAAQTLTPSSSTAAQQVVRGTTSAQVTQNVNLILPQATALHLTASTLDFDISKLGTQDNTWYCAYGLSATDQTLNLGEDLWNQTQTKPIGTSYTVGDYPSINVVAGKKVTSYPPADIVNGTVDNATKNYFVCYRSFILQKFSNVGNYRLSVSRDNPSGDMGHQMIYMQEDPCNAWGSPPTGLYKINENSNTLLTPRSLTTGTTGQGASKANASSNNSRNFCRQGTSWLDDVIVVAVVIDGDKAGTNTAALTYTLESSAMPFAVAKAP